MSQVLVGTIAHCRLPRHKFLKGAQKCCCGKMSLAMAGETRTRKCGTCRGLKVIRRLSATGASANTCTKCNGTGREAL